ncbi:trypsin-like peptidase domain-containing protein [Thermoleophilum album]|uniref:S1C family serine protease n=1 Tax=Thermoleophilum album TaxID=29539 RepID=UPI00237CC57F|nr:trypsin-like peptidase domain-containing protein [Thermoleophilum album]WDT92958.1 trypsin-like peptidase domain-containing protein [Thermoleophilum album]
MEEQNGGRKIAVGHLLSGVVGGLLAAAVVLLLGVAGVVDFGETRDVVRERTVVRGSGGSSLDVSAIYREAGPGVVYVEAQGGTDTSPFGLPSPNEEATGSGVVLDRDGNILTNWHVVEGARSIAVRFSENGELVPAELKGRDPSSDLAVVKVDPDRVGSKLVPLPLGNSARVKVGDPVVAIGNPFGLSRTVTTGIVSAVQRQIQAPNGFTIPNAIQTDAAINPGNSGGPLLDAEGRVIGINSQIVTGGSRGSVGIGFAVPIDLAKRLLPQLKEGGVVKRAYLGIEMTDLTSQLAEDLNLPVRSGALITTVVPRSPAARAGLRGGRTRLENGLRAGGDVIVEIDGRRVRSAEDVTAIIGERSPGDTVRIVYYRGRERRTTQVELGTRPARLATQTLQEQSPLP